MAKAKIYLDVNSLISRASVLGQSIHFDSKFIDHTHKENKEFYYILYLNVGVMIYFQAFGSPRAVFASETWI